MGYEPNLFFWNLLELIDRYAHIENYKKNIRYSINQESKNFLVHIEQRLDEVSRKIHGLIDILNDGKFDLSDFDSPQYEEIWRNCVDINEKDLESKILGGLGALEYPSLRPEIKYFLKDAYNVDTNISFKPSYNYTAIDFTFDRSDMNGGEVITLPLISNKSPELWVGASHELGHFRRHTVTKEFIKKCSDILEEYTVQQVWRDWLEELACDLFALKTLGPTYFINYVFLSLLDISVYNPLTTSLSKLYKKSSDTHPTHYARIEIMYRICDFSSEEYSLICKNIYDNFKLIKNFEDTHESFRDFVEDLKIFKDIRSKEDNLISNSENFNEIMDDIINSEFPQSFMEKEDVKLSYELAEEVWRKESPIGVYTPKDKDQILSLVNDLKEKYEHSKLNELLKIFDDEPIKMPVLFNAFQLVKLWQLQDLYKGLKERKVEEELQKYFDETVTFRDELFLKSIEISTICKFYKNKED